MYWVSVTRGSPVNHLQKGRTKPFLREEYDHLRPLPGYDRPDPLGDFHKEDILGASKGIYKGLAPDLVEGY
jgi:hypothetical protein